ncbi:hypothetical protein CON84_02925 [Bacillus sp. AFS094228]|nr:hypothetical protein CON84_02925 [Bacillus sp. AFS094228]
MAEADSWRKGDGFLESTEKKFLRTFFRVWIDRLNKRIPRTGFIKWNNNEKTPSDCGKGLFP